MAQITLCADDFGLTAAACRSILWLGRLGAISATSCCVEGPAIGDHVSALRELRPRFGVGLHLDLTTPRPAGTERPLEHWILATTLRLPSVRGAAAQAALSAEIGRQLDRFEMLFGTPPDHVDGHEHVHQFAGIRGPLLEILARRYGTRVALRSTSTTRWRGVKAAIIATLGAGALTAEAARRGMRCNTDFAGVYDLRQAEGYLARLRDWLAGIGDGALLMCHPEDGDGALPARRHEHDTLASPDWTALRARLGLELVPLRGTGAG